MRKLSILSCIPILLDSKENGPTRIKILGYDGSEKMYTTYQLSSGKNVIPLDISSLNTGVYFIEVQNNQYSSIKKLIKVN